MSDGADTRILQNSFSFLEQAIEQAYLFLQAVLLSAWSSSAQA